MGTTKVESVALSARSTSSTPSVPPPTLRAATLPIPRLSNELTAHIIDCLHDDPQSLKNCALACRAFLPRVRDNFFRSVSLNLKNSAKFARLLDDAPAVGACVRELHVTVAAHEQDQGRPWVDRLLPTMAPALPNVAALHLRGKGPYRAAPLTALESVRTIHIWGCEIESINEFCAIMGAFPRLEGLYTNEPFVYRCKEITVKNTARPQGFRTLVFNSARVDPGMLGDWMIQEEIHTNLEYFACCPIQQIGVPPMSRLLKAIGPSLKHYKIALVGLEAQGGFVELLEKESTLTSNVNLRVLEFGSPAAYSALYGADDLSFAWFPTMLGQVRSRRIETVGFFLWDDDLDGLATEAWDNIVRVLSSDQFATLLRLEVHAWGDPEKAQAIVEAVKLRFADFEERGILFIDDVPDPAC